MAVKTYEDLIVSVNSASIAVAQDTTALAADQSKLAADQSLLAEATAARNQAVVAGAGSVVVDNGDGTYLIYESDTGGGVVVKKGLSSKTPLPGQEAAVAADTHALTPDPNAAAPAPAGEKAA